MTESRYVAGYIASDLNRDFLAGDTSKLMTDSMNCLAESIVYMDGRHRIDH